jgi:hypothetical protein
MPRLQYSEGDRGPPLAADTTTAGKNIRQETMREGIALAKGRIFLGP